MTSVSFVSCKLNEFDRADQNPKACCALHIKTYLLTSDIQSYLQIIKQTQLVRNALNNGLGCEILAQTLVA